MRKVLTLGNVSILINRNLPMTANQSLFEMTVMPIIMDLADQGVFPYVNGNRLVMTPAARMTGVLRHRVLVNKHPLMSGLVELQRLAGPEWAAFEVRTDRLKAFAEMMMVSEMREQGVAPEHYTAATEPVR